MNAIIQRLKSKTYWVAILGAALTIVEANANFLSGFLPAEYSKYAIMAWPILMLTLREVTTSAISDK
jgi:uncharacterized membrane protein